MFEDTTLTVVLLLMIAMMGVGLVGVIALNKGNRELEKEIRAKKAQREKTAQSS